MCTNYYAIIKLLFQIHWVLPINSSQIENKIKWFTYLLCVSFTICSGTPGALYNTTFSFRFVTKWRQQFLYIYFGPSVAQQKKYKRLWKVVFSISCTDFFFRALTTVKLCSVFYSLCRCLYAFFADEKMLPIVRPIFLW